MRFGVVQDGEWIQPVMKGFKIKCCDCGLIHKLDFRIVKGRVQSFRCPRRRKSDTLR
jgi:hypothetical protein